MQQFTRRYSISSEEEYLPTSCCCETLAYDDEPCGDICDFCKEKEHQELVRSAIEAANWAMTHSEEARKREKQIKFIGKNLTTIDQTATVEAKLPLIAETFAYVARCGSLLAGHPRFRNIFIAKIEEFQADKRAEPIWETLRQVRAMLDHLPGRSDYVA